MFQYLVALWVEIQACDSSVSSLSETDELLWTIPLKHPHTAVLSTRHIWKHDKDIKQEFHQNLVFVCEIKRHSQYW